MANEHEIKSEKILVKEIFSNYWFCIPEYQRPYVWGSDEIDELLDDLTFAHSEKPEQEYFLGSFVYQSKKAGSTPGQEFNENDLLDGQQRMTTLLMLFACIRDMSSDQEVKEVCSEVVYQKGSSIKRIPERTRIVFAIREAAQEFIDQFVKPAGGTDDVDGLAKAARDAEDRSIRNMASAILRMLSYLSQPERGLSLDSFLGFLLNQVLLIYVATENLEDAFRLFTILNNRGVPLRNSDILKSQNLGALTNQKEKEKYARLWEETEGELGEDFDRFLNHIRTILLKDKARLNLLDEFEHKIYHPKEKDKSTGELKPKLLTKGKETFELVERYLKHYDQLLGGKNYDETGGSFEFDNLVNVMQVGLPSTDWLPPLMRYFDRFGYERLQEFLVLLDNQLSYDWILQYTPTDRIDRMNNLIRQIEAANSVAEVFPGSGPGSDAGGFTIDVENFKAAIDPAVYGRRHTRYLLLKLDYLFADHSNRMSLETLSVEHVLPQNPEPDSRWCKDYSEEQRQLWTHRLGNLVLISTRKNTSQGNLDYADKKTRYFDKRISTCPNSLRVLKNEKWTPVELEANHNTVLKKLCDHYQIKKI
jgi:hypothetical protein